MLTLISSKQRYNLLIWSFSQLEGELSNLGDRAILSATIANIRKEIPAAEIKVISSDPAQTMSTYNVTGIYYKNIRAILRAIKQADLIVLGGGEFIQDKSSFAYLLLNLSVGIIALLFKRPICFYAIGVGNKEEISLFGRYLSRLVLERAKFITLRDEDSFKTLRSFLKTFPPMVVTADPAIALPSISKKLSDEILLKYGITTSDYPLICFSPRKILLRNFGGLIPLGLQIKLGVESLESAKLNSKIAEVLASTLDHLLQKHSGKIVFVPMYNGANFSYHDSDFALEIIEKMSNKSKAIIIEANHFPEEVQAVLNRADVVASMTLHALILSTKNYVPMVAITYSSKAERFMRLIMQSDYIIKVSHLTAKDLIDKIEEALSKKKLLTKLIEERVVILHEKASLNAKFVKVCLEYYSKKN